MAHWMQHRFAFPLALAFGLWPVLLSAQQRQEVELVTAAPTTTPAEHAIRKGVRYLATLQDAQKPSDALKAYDLTFSSVLNAEPTVRASYMGIGVETPGDSLRSQLKLADGTGLVITWVDDASPAKGLLRQHDVLQKFDDQILINSDQLVTLVRLHKPGEAVSLSLVRESRPITVALKLAEKDVSPLRSILRVNTLSDDAVQSLNGLRGNTLSNAVLSEKGDRIGAVNQFLSDQLVVVLTDPTTRPTTQPDRATILRRLSLDLTGVPPAAAEVEAFVNDKSPDAYQKVVERLTSSPAHKQSVTTGAWSDTERVSTAQPGPWEMSKAGDLGTGLVIVASGDVITRAARSGPVTIDDGELLMWLQPGEAGAELTVLERSTGKNLFKGPIGTAEEWKAVPENVRKKFDDWRAAMQRASHAPAEKK